MIHSVCSFIALPSIAFLVVGHIFAQNLDVSADDVLATYINALGGEDNLSAVTSLKVTERQTIKSTSSGALAVVEVTTFSHDGKWVSVESTGNRFGYDGNRLWVQLNRQSPRWNDDNYYASNAGNPISHALHLAHFPGTLTFVGNAETDGRKVYRLAVTPPQAAPKDRPNLFPTELQFDVETGYLVQVLFEFKTVKYGDYRDVGNVIIPHRRQFTYRIADIDQTVTTEITSIDQNPNVKADLFVAPVDGDNN